MAKTLGISFEQTRLSVRTNSRRVDVGEKGWTVCNSEGVSVTKPFRTREQAECLADQKGDFVVVEVPILWIKDLATIRAIPLNAVASFEEWFQTPVEPTEAFKAEFAAAPKGVGHARPT